MIGLYRIVRGVIGAAPDEIAVEGTLKVDEKKDDGYVVSLFDVQANSVKAAPK